METIESESQSIFGQCTRLKNLIKICMNSYFSLNPFFATWGVSSESVFFFKKIFWFLSRIILTWKHPQHQVFSHLSNIFVFCVLGEFGELCAKKIELFGQYPQRNVWSKLTIFDLIFQLCQSAMLPMFFT